MKDIGKALAGNAMIRDRNNPIMEEKYISPFSEWIKGIIEDCKERTNAKDLYEDTKIRWQKMNIYDPENNITVINLLSKKCLNRDCYVPRITSHNENIEYVCGRRQLRGCPKKYIAEEKWNRKSDKYNQWDLLGQDKKDELIQEVDR